VEAGERFAVPFVKAVVLGGEGFLLQRRIKEGDPYQGFWELPGGRMRFGETAEGALGRELEEETGLTLRVVLGQGETALTDRFGRSVRAVRPLVTVEVTSGPWPVIGHYFACLTDGRPHPTEEGAEHRFISPQEFRREFLDPGSVGDCATLDLLALRIIIEEGRLAAC
jgi:8-oxo-dGTP pyrophosphatase MutT (NUDIX family)